MTDTPKEEWVYDLAPLLMAFAYDPDRKAGAIMEWVAAHKAQWEKEERERVVDQCEAATKYAVTLARLEGVREGKKMMDSTLDEALNSGNGTYKP
jgi:squalene cyclase